MTTTTTTTTTVADVNDPVGELLLRHPQKSCKLENGETLTYREFGNRVTSKHTLVFLPGYTCDADSFAAIFACHPSFAEDHYTVAMNPRGYGGSTCHNPCNTHEENAQDIKDMMDQLGITHAMVMGFSAGGGAAAVLAIQYPETIRAGILMNGIPLDGLPGKVWTDEGLPTDEDLTSKDQVPTFVRAFHNMGLFGTLDEKYNVWTNMFKAKICPPDSPEMKRWHEACHMMDEKARISSPISTFFFNVTPIQTPTMKPSMVLKQLKVPLIVIHGDNDTVAQTDHVESLTKLAIAKNWGNGHISYYHHSGGHFPMFENLDEFCQVYRKALSEQVCC